ncbi:MAG: hypothetical protein R3202_01935 [Candidatus Competibacterales bacterium]|nr:hypothetical protein [Candidatus Competibacterales bacterium]
MSDIPGARPSDTEILPIEDVEQAAAALVDLLKNTRRQFLLYTPAVAPDWLEDDDVINHLRRLVLQQPRAQCLLLLPPAQRWRRSCPRLTKLIQQLGALELRTPPADVHADKAAYNYGFAIGDERHLLLLNDPVRCAGSLTLGGGAQGRQLAEFFTELWEHGRKDVELRKLGI